METTFFFNPMSLLVTVIPCFLKDNKPPSSPPPFPSIFLMSDGDLLQLLSEYQRERDRERERETVADNNIIFISLAVRFSLRGRARRGDGVGRRNKQTIG